MKKKSEGKYSTPFRDLQIEREEKRRDKERLNDNEKNGGRKEQK